MFLTVSTCSELLKDHEYLVGFGCASTGHTRVALRPRPIPCTILLRFAQVGSTAGGIGDSVVVQKLFRLWTTYT